MWIVFGWEMQERSIGEVGAAYCYDCRRMTEWIVWNESEWATLSDIRVLRFINKHRLHCESCTFFLQLSPREFRAIDRHMRRNDSIEGTALHAALVGRIETEQFSTKTPLQIRFIRESMTAERALEEQLKQSEDRER